MPKINQQPKTTKISIFKTDFNRFEIKFTFNKQILESCREIPGRRFMDNKRWSFPIQQYSNFIKKFKKMPKVEIVKELDQKEQDDIQVVILDESSTELEVAFPKNDELYEITKEILVPPHPTDGAESCVARKYLSPGLAITWTKFF